MKVLEEMDLALGRLLVSGAVSDMAAKELLDVARRAAGEGLSDAMSVFSARQVKMQAEAQKQSASHKKVKDCADDAKRCNWAIHVLRAEVGRRKKASKG